MTKKEILPLTPKSLALINEIRKVIASTSDKISEEVKWNSPSFFYNGEMQPFNAKEYKRDLVVLNCREERILLVFPTGNRIPDEDQFLEGNYPDGRRMVTIRSIQELEIKKSSLQKVISIWLQNIGE
ncbi:MAG: DUF1801 domain-containing protein [Crocinitomicaceae bacterium]